MTVITLSRQLGCHGEEIAAKVAQALGLRLIDIETINQGAEKAGVPPQALAELEHEGARSLANQVLKALRIMPSLRSPAPGTEEDEVAQGLTPLAIPFGGLFSPTVPPISASLESYVRLVGLVIRGLAHEGNVLILGRGGQVLLKNHAGALHIQIVAPLAYRVEVLRARQGVSAREAQSQLRASDRARSDYLRRYHDVDWLDPTLYHLAINTGRVAIPTAVDLIIDAHRAMEQPAGGNSAEK